MTSDTFEMTQSDVRERTESITNLCYITYTDSNIKIMLCTFFSACLLIVAPYIIVGTNGMSMQAINSKWLWILVSTTLCLSVIIILTVLFIILSNKQYLVKSENGKNILVVGSFRRLRKYYVNGACYIIKNGYVEKVSKRKKKDDIFALFSLFKKNEIMKRVDGNKEVFLIKQKNSEDFFTAGTMPFKYGVMKFANGKFYKGSFSSSKRHNCVYYKVVKNDVKCNDIVPIDILRLVEKKHKGSRTND